MEHPSIARYDAVTRALHWTTAVIVLIAFIYGPGGPEHRIYAPDRDFDRQLHETLGMFVFALVLIRLMWRMFYTRPEPPQMPRWQTIAAASVQGTLLLLMFALPLTAVTGAWLEGHAVTLLAGVEIQPMLALSHDTGKFIANIHGWLGDAILWIAGLHAVAAIYHHLFLKDNVLVSMLPPWLPLHKQEK